MISRNDGMSQQIQDRESANACLVRETSLKLSISEVFVSSGILICDCGIWTLQ